MKLFTQETYQAQQNRHPQKLLTKDAQQTSNAHNKTISNMPKPTMKNMKTPNNKIVYTYDHLTNKAIYNRYMSSKQ